MRRKTLDLILTCIGAGLTVTLIAAGALLMWGYSFATNNVHDQLAMQQITFPTAAEMAQAKAGTEITPGMLPYIQQYAGQQVLTGPQAEAYANHFIAVHLSEMPYNGVYSKVSAASMADPKNTALSNEVQTVFRGTTLRGLLLEAYGFWKFGEIALVGAIISFVLAGIMAVLTVIGWFHYRRVPEEQEFPQHHADTQVQDKEPATV
jgi:hypothetical protein